MNEEIHVFGDISRDTLDRSDSVTYSTLARAGIDEEIVRQIASANNEPDWMLEHRLKSLRVFESMTKPTW
jgi:Fe-S cluster assembly protein SufB